MIATKHRFIRALYRESVDCTPVWIMRQAGRYLPEYQDLRFKAKSFLNLCKTPELACIATLQPIERFPLDAAIIFSDILTIPDALGLELYFREDIGPQFLKPLCHPDDICGLRTIDPEIELKYVMDAIRMAVHELNGKIPLIGFSGSPWTLATYMVEGGVSKQFNKIRAMLYQDPKTLHVLLAHLTRTVIQYLSAQIKAGVSAIMLFDTWGGILAKEQYLAFSLHYMQEIIASLKTDIPIILFTKNGGQHLTEIACTGCQGIGLDWLSNLKEAKELVGHQVALQGNLDPAVLYGDADCIQKSVQNVLEQFGSGGGHIFNLGHGIHRDTSPEKVAIMVEAVHRLSQTLKRE